MSGRLSLPGPHARALWYLIDRFLKFLRRVLVFLLRSGECIDIMERRLTPPYPHSSGLLQWARGDVGLKPTAAARPKECEK